MIRFIIVLIVAAVVYFGYNHFSINKFVDDSQAAMSNGKIIKTVSDRRAMDYEQAEKAGENNF